jgi:hypothetical protein
MADLASGVAGGAAAGSVAGPWGAAIGAGAGGLLSLMGSDDQAAGIESQIQAQKEMLELQFQQNKISREEYMQSMQDIYNPSEEKLAELYAPFSGLAGQGVEEMQREGGPVREDFKYGKTVEDFLDPSIDYQKEQATRAVNASGAATGSMLSGAAQKAIADRAQQIGKKGYGDASNRMVQDRNFEQGKHYTDYGLDVDAEDTRYNKASNLASLGLGAIDNTAGAIRFGTAGRAGGNLAPVSAPLMPSSSGLSQIQSGKTKQALGGQLINMGGQYLANQYGR